MRCNWKHASFGSLPAETSLCCTTWSPSWRRNTPKSWCSRRTWRPSRRQPKSSRWPGPAAASLTGFSLTLSGCFAFVAWLSWKKTSTTCAAAWRVWKVWVTQIWETNPVTDQLLCMTLHGRLCSGARLPEAAAAGAGRQVCVGGEPVHHRGQFQLLRRGGLPQRGQGAGESPPLVRAVWAERTPSLSLADTKSESCLPVSSAQLLGHASLTPSVASAGRLTVGVKCSSFLPLKRPCFISQSSHCLRVLDSFILRFG